jgi:hypothetical protein
VENYYFQQLNAHVVSDDTHTEIHGPTAEPIVYKHTFEIKIPLECLKIYELPNADPWTLPMVSG